MLACAHAQSLEVIDLHHRTAEQVLPQVQAIVGEHGVATGTGFKLFVRTDAGTLAQVRRMVAELDVAQRRLMVSVRQVDAGAMSRSEIQTGVRIDPRGTTVTAAGSAQAERSDASIVQQVQALEGMPALIRIGEQRLVPNAVVTYGAAGPSVGVVATPVDADTGFYVVAHVRGDEVMLDVHPQHSSFGPQGELRSRAMSTQVAGRLGEWIDLGSAVAQSATRGAGIAGANSADMDARMHVQVKVDAQH